MADTPERAITVEDERRWIAERQPAIAALEESRRRLMALPVRARIEVGSRANAGEDYETVLADVIARWEAGEVWTRQGRTGV